MATAMREWKELADEQAYYDLKLAALLRDISQAIANYRFYCKDCLKS